ncbi:hypothetical protein EGN72_00275, partial [Pseudorhodobacter sp. E13]|uniref:hypothetical protein n=1 Tax=Pseudorhodobacter sp. E13 TaxID=2487931 RepID=UPI000F995351
LDFRTPWDDASVEIMTGDGHRIAALDGQGCRLPNIDDAAPMMPTVIGSSLIAVGNGFDGVVADLGGLTAHSVAPKNAKSVRAVVDLPLIGPRRAVTAGPAGKGFLIPDDPQILYCMIGLGQSLCAGVSSANSLMSTVTPYPDDALMFDLATGV